MDSAKKKRFIDEISYLGVKKIPFLLSKTGSERISAFSGSLSVDEIYSLWNLLPIEGFGLYLGKQMIDRRTGRKESRLGLDGLNLLKEQVDKNIIQLTEEQETEWWKGRDVDVNEEQVKHITGGEFVAVLSCDGKDFVGTGKINQEKKILFTFLPKERRRREN